MVFLKVYWRFETNYWFSLRFIGVLGDRRETEGDRGETDGRQRHGKLRAGLLVALGIW